MRALFKRIINTYHYKLESIKNRYPCKIIDVINIDSTTEETLIKYIAASKINIRESTAKEILDDPLLIEKFHPTDGVKLGFIAFGQTILNNNDSLDESRKNYKKIARNLFNDLNN